MDRWSGPGADQNMGSSSFTSGRRLCRAQDRRGSAGTEAAAPDRRRSMLIALEDLHLAPLRVGYPGDQAYDLDDRISVILMADGFMLHTGGY